MEGDTQGAASGRIIAERRILSTEDRVDLRVAVVRDAHGALVEIAFVHALSGCPLRTRKGSWNQLSANTRQGTRTAN
jgi:hypothetical protein